MVVVQDFVGMNKYSEDYGHYIIKTPSLVVFPLNKIGLQEALDYAVENGLKIIARGAGKKKFFAHFF